MKKIRKQILVTWQIEWTEQVLREEECRKAIGLVRFYRTSARISIPIFKSKALNLNIFSRGSQSSYFQARTGIGNNLAYLYKIGKVNSDICNFCDKEKQTTLHLILDCTYSDGERKKEFDGLEPLNMAIFFNTKVGRLCLLKFLQSGQ